MVHRQTQTTAFSYPLKYYSLTIYIVTDKNKGVPQIQRMFDRRKLCKVPSFPPSLKLSNHPILYCGVPERLKRTLVRVCYAMLSQHEQQKHELFQRSCQDQFSVQQTTVFAICISSPAAFGSFHRMAGYG